MPKQITSQEHLCALRDIVSAIIDHPTPSEASLRHSNVKYSRSHVEPGEVVIFFGGTSILVDLLLGEGR